MLAKILFLLLVTTTLWGKSVTCVRDRTFQFSRQGSNRVGNITIYNRYQNGECSITLSITRTTVDGESIDEQFSFSDLGRLGTFISSTRSFPSSRNSRATGARSFYLLPKKHENVSYEIQGNKLIINMVNGEKAILDTKSGNILDITNTAWSRDKALRSYIRHGKVVAQDVYSKQCANCALKYKIKYDHFKYSSGSLLITGVDHGVVLATKFRRGSDGRLPTLWGHTQKTTIMDKYGHKCIANNTAIFKYKYEQFGKHKSIDKIFLRDITNQSIRKRLKQICGEKIIFTEEKTPSPTSCTSCPNIVTTTIPTPPTDDIQQIVKHIQKNKITPSQMNIQRGAFKSKRNALRLIQQQKRSGNQCRLKESPDFFRIFCQR